MIVEEIFKRRDIKKIEHDEINFNLKNQTVSPIHEIFKQIPKYLLINPFAFKLNSNY